MVGTRQRLGLCGEELAAQELTRQGLAILARNVRTRDGELDLVARDGDSLVVVEVRTRRGESMGSAAESVNSRKRARLIHLAQAYMAELDWRGPWRIDVIAIQIDRQGKLRSVDWIRNAVEGP